MKWFQMDSDWLTAPAAMRIRHRHGFKGLGHYVALLAFVAAKSPPDRPGLALQPNGEPIATDDLMLAIDCTEQELDDLIAILLDTGEMDYERWTQRRELYLPGMAAKADRYTKRVLASKRGQDGDTMCTQGDPSSSLLLSGTDVSSEVDAPPDTSLVLFPLPPTLDQQCEVLREAWNAIMPKEIAKCQVISESRKRHCKRRLTERSIEEWTRDVFPRIAVSDFCRGLNDRGWCASFDWVMSSPDTAIKVLEGKYDNRRPARPPQLGRTGAAAAGKYTHLVRRERGNG